MALHELYAIGRGLRPIVLGGYVGLVLTLVGTQTGGIVWMIGGLISTVSVAFVVFGFSDARPSATAAIALTLLGVVWVGGGLAFLMLLRDIPEHGRLAIFTVLIAVFADDTAAFFFGRMLGRHKMAPTISPGKSWEGFVGGDDRRDGGRVLRDVRPGLPDERRGARARRRGRGLVGSRRPVRVGRSSATSASRTRAASSRATVACSTASIRCSGRGRPRSTSSSPWHERCGEATDLRQAVPVTRIALLGATGSIGRQALEIVGRNPELELCALLSGSRPLDALAAAHGVEHVQVGGDARRLLDACEPDLVLNAIVGFAGVGATLWALEHGVTLALANKESLVAAGELAVAAHRRGRGLLLPVDSEHSALFQCLEGRDPDDRRGARADRLRRAVSRQIEVGARRRDGLRRRSPIRPGRWDERSLWTPRHSRTRASS